MYLKCCNMFEWEWGDIFFKTLKGQLWINCFNLNVSLIFMIYIKKSFSQI